MATIRLTRTLSGYHAGALDALVEDLTRKLSAQVKPVYEHQDDDDITVLCTVVAPVDAVRIACAAMVHEPVLWEAH